MSPAETGRAFSDLAEAVVRALLMHTEEAFAARHGRLPGACTAVVAFGRLGSREMTAGSDLDLIVIYDHAAGATASDGERPLPPSQYYARLTQRLVAALAAPTGEGIAYEVDLRLRPSGRAGPLATHVAAFEAYQLSEAWTWEHMAMSRGRVIAGDAGLSERVAGILDALVAKPREPAVLAAEVASMRARIEHEKTAAGPFDVKLAPGGLLDCEFAAQYLVLAGLGRVGGETTLETLERARAAGALEEAAGERLVLSATLQTAILQLVRVADPKQFAADQAPEALKRLMLSLANAALQDAGLGEERAGVGNFDALAARLSEVQAKTRQALESVLQTKVE